MRNRLKLLPKLVLVAGVSLALTFGAREASACTACDWHPIACASQIDPDLYCKNYCVNVAGCFDGACIESQDECLCAK